VVEHDLRVEALGMLQEALHQVGALHAHHVGGPVVDLGGRHQLAALGHAGDQQRLQVGARGVDGGGVAGRAGAEDQHAGVGVGHGSWVVGQGCGWLGATGGGVASDPRIRAPIWGATRWLQACHGHNSRILADPRGARRGFGTGSPEAPGDQVFRTKEGLPMSMLSNLDLIRRVPLFSMLTADQAQAVADSVVKRRFRRGELVVEQGRKSNALFILLNGRARVLTSDSRGREVILAVLESGDYVGEMSLIDNEPHSATVRAEVQTDMLVLARADFARCLPENSTLSYAILRGLVRRLRNADRQIESLALLDVYGRVARTLLDMAEDDNGVKIIRHKVSRQDMAKVVGASREMVSRVMKDLEDRGVIETQDNGFVIIKERLQND
jgi:CRP/FNR family cyclic AMP-dependent transcriptional regulator